LKVSSLKYFLIFLFIITFPPLAVASNTFWIPDWRKTTPMPYPRAGAATVIVKDLIYVIGGVDGRHFLNTTIYAKIKEDGSIGEWHGGPKLKEPRGFIGAVAYKNFIYVIGGGNGPYGEHLLNTIEKAPILPDGHLGPWEIEKEKMIIPRRCAKVAIYNNIIYAFGGFGGTLLDNVEYAPVNSDGSLGKWKLLSKTMNLPRYISGVKKWKNRIYIVGGHDYRGRGMVEVEWSIFPETLKRGNLTWRMTSPLNTGRYGLSTIILDDVIYALGGISGSEYLDTIEMGHINPDGKVSPWKIIRTHLPAPLAFSDAVTYKNRIYLIGGTNVDGYSRDVYYATIGHKGEIGFYGTEKELLVYRERVKRRVNPLPKDGIVLDILQTPSYTYLKVKSEGEIIWLATSRIEISPFTRIRYSKGVLMTDFYSRELKRTFPKILFVSKVKPVRGE